MRESFLPFSCLFISRRGRRKRCTSPRFAAIAIPHGRRYAIVCICCRSTIFASKLCYRTEESEREPLRSIHPRQSTCLFWRARDGFNPLRLSRSPSHPSSFYGAALREGGNGCALGNFPKRTQFGHLACSVSPFFSLRRGAEVRGGIATLPCNDDLGGVMSNGK